MVDRIQKFLASLDEKTKLRIKKKLLKVKEDPFKASGVKKLKGWGENVYRVRIGKIRVIYKVLEDDIEIVDMDFRGNIYETITPPALAGGWIVPRIFLSVVLFAYEI